MKKNYLPFIILILSVFGKLAAQDCLPAGITFSTQAQINAFSTNYPDCTELLGNVIIKGLPAGNITNLSGLIQLTSIGGDLRIESNTALTSLTGLDNITSIGGELRIYYNDALASLTGLDNITSIGGELYISVHFVLTSLTALDNLTSIGGNLIIGSNPDLTSLAGLDNLTSIGGNLSIHHNDALTSLAELDNLTSIGGYLHIQYNYSLTSLAGLDNIDHTTITFLFLLNLANLSTCEVQSICDYLGNSGAASVSGNALGCNSVPEIETACSATPIDELLENYGIQISPNPTSSIIQIDGINIVDWKIKVRNTTGMLIKSYQFIENGQIDLSELSSGIYFLELRNKYRIVIKKIIKE